MNAEVHSLAGPFVLDALTGPERELFERHLSTCASCQHEVHELGATAARLGSAASSPPPPGLKAKVMAEVAATRQLPPPLTARRERRRLSGWRGGLLAAAAAIVLVAGAGVAVVEVRNAQRQAREAAARQTEITTVLSAPDSHTVHAPVRGGGRATVVVSAREDRAVVVLDALPVRPSDETYQLWYIAGSQARSAGVVDVDHPGQQSRLLSDGVASAQAVGITVEPRGGSKAPTSKPIALISLG
jgi:anti-sigma-K factor RskA